MKILVTAFDPFGGETVNPAYEAVKRLQAPAGAELVRLEVPTVFGRSIDVLEQAMERERPDAVVCVGQAGGRSAITPERVAINLMDATIPDNAGYTPVDEPVVKGGENALFSTLPVKAMVSAIQDAGIPAQLSYTAGTFVCNQLLYGLLHLCRYRFPGTKGCFIHVPYLPCQTARKPQCPSMALETMVSGLEAAIRIIAE